MEFHQLRYFVAVAEEGNFTRAAEKMRIAQPSLSQQIAKLEKELGQVLFDRLSRRITLTQAGEQLLEHARKILAETEDARRKMADASTQIAGKLTVGVIPTIGPYCLPQIIRAFSDRYPEVELSLVEDYTERLLELLDRGELDLALISSAKPPSAVFLETVTSEPLMVLVPGDHPLRNRKSVPWKAFEGEPFLLLQDMHCLSGQVMEACHLEASKPRIVLRAGQLETIAMMVSAGLGVSVVPRMMARQDHVDSRAYLPFSAPAPSRELCIATNINRYRTKAALAFSEITRQIWKTD